MLTPSESEEDEDWTESSRWGQRNGDVIVSMTTRLVTWFRKFGDSDLLFCLFVC